MKCFLWGCTVVCFNKENRCKIINSVLLLWFCYLTTQQYDTAGHVAHYSEVIHVCLQFFLCQSLHCDVTMTWAQRGSIGILYWDPVKSPVFLFVLDLLQLSSSGHSPCLARSLTHFLRVDGLATSKSTQINCIFFSWRIRVPCLPLTHLLLKETDFIEGH